MSKSKTPNKNLNFIQNYFNHLKAVDSKLGKEIKYLSGKRTFRQEIQRDVLGREKSGSDVLLGHINAFDPLKDGHDYMDNIMGATVGTLIGAAVSIIFLASGLYEGIMSLVTSGAEPAKHYDNMQVSLSASLLTAAVTLINFANSFVSVFTRPVITAINGWDKSKEDRFRDEFSEKNSFLEEVADTVGLTA